MTKNSTLSAFAQKAKPKFELVEFPEYDAKFHVMELSAFGKAQLESVVGKRQKRAPASESDNDLAAAGAATVAIEIEPSENCRLRFEIIHLCVQTPDGKPLIEEADDAAYETFCQLPTSVTDLLFDTAWELNGMSLKAKKKRETDTAKN